VSEGGLVSTVFDSCQYGYSSALVQNTNGEFYGTGGPAIASLNTGLGPFVTFVVPADKVGQTVQILGLQRHRGGEIHRGQRHLYDRGCAEGRDQRPGCGDDSHGRFDQQSQLYGFQVRKRDAVFPVLRS
jgi:hypothetical protein